MRSKTLTITATLLLVLGCGDQDPPRQDTVGQYWDQSSIPTPDLYPAACSPLNCAGCCSSVTGCVSVPNDTACGYGGMACKACKANEKCIGGVCQSTTCGPTNCTGCCDAAGKCQPGTTNDACGTGGATCTKCGSSSTCTSGKCQSTGPKMYKVTLVSATVSGCGLGDTCDAFVVLKVGNTTKTSATKDDTNTPVWKEYMLTESDTNLQKGFSVTVYDEDLAFDDTIGTCTPTISAAVLSAGKLVTTCGNASKLTFTFAQ